MIKFVKMQVENKRAIVNHLLEAMLSTGADNPAPPPKKDIEDYYILPRN